MAETILESIGNTPLVELRNIVPPGSARVVVKLEWANPTGSMKDRMARAVIERAEETGKIRKGDTVIDYTGGTTGISLAFICAAKGYGFHAVFSDAFSDEKRAVMEAYGATVTVLPSGDRRITADLIRSMIETARRLSRQPGHWWADQIGNHDAVTGYYPLGEEIWNQTGGRIDAFVQTVGSAHSLHGVTRSLWKHNAKIHIAAGEPAESAVLSGGPPGAHQIEGIGIGFIPALWDPGMVNEIIPVPTSEAMAMARRLAREEGLLAGTSSGANVIAALRIAERLGPGATVATLLVDSGLRYISTPLFARSAG